MTQQIEFIELLLPNYILFFIILCLKLYLDTLEHKHLGLICEKSFLALFRLFRGPPKKNGWKLRDPTSFFAILCITEQAVDQIGLVLAPKHLLVHCRARNFDYIELDF